MASNNLFDNPKLSDLKIRFNGQEIHAHKAIVCTHSTYFDAAVTKDFLEAKSGVLDLKDDNGAENVRAMIRHMYNLPYYLGYGAFADVVNEDLLFHAEVFNIGDKYDVPSLRSVVVVEFTGLMENASYDTAAFAVAVKAVYANHDGRADNSLEQVVLEFCACHMDRLHWSKDFASMLEEVAPLSGALLHRVWSGLAKGPEVLRCHYCYVLVDQHMCHLCTDGRRRDPLDNTFKRAKVLFLD